MLFQSQWQMFKFESLKETGSFSGFFLLWVFFSLMFQFQRRKKKPNSVCLASGTSGNSQPTARCPLPEDVYGIKLLGSQEHRAWPFSLPPPPALHHQVTPEPAPGGVQPRKSFALISLSCLEPHGIYSPVQYPATALKMQLYCLLLTEQLNLGPEQPKVGRWSRK